jgi:hypothetical protein
MFRCCCFKLNGTFRLTGADLILPALLLSALLCSAILRLFNFFSKRDIARCVCSDNCCPFASLLLCSWRNLLPVGLLEDGSTEDCSPVEGFSEGGPTERGRLTNPLANLFFNMSSKPV